MTAPDISPEAVNKVCNALAGLCVTHPHFAAPGQAMELLHQMSLALTASEKRAQDLQEQLLEHAETCTERAHPAEAMRKDAARYRWLRDQNRNTSPDKAYACITWNIGHDWITSDDLDGTIDSAMEATNGA